MLSWAAFPIATQTHLQEAVNCETPRQMQRIWCPQRDSNPRYRLEGPVSSACLDDGGIVGANQASL